MGKRERSMNFKKEETDLLMRLVHEKSDVVNFKGHGAKVWHEKNSAWDEITKKYNRLTDNVQRTKDALKTKYMLIRKPRNRSVYQAMERQLDYERRNFEAANDAGGHMSRDERLSMLLSLADEKGEEEVDEEDRNGSSRPKRSSTNSSGKEKQTRGFCELPLQVKMEPASDSDEDSGGGTRPFSDAGQVPEAVYNNFNLEAFAKKRIELMDMQVRDLKATFEDKQLRMSILRLEEEKLKAEVSEKQLKVSILQQEESAARLKADLLRLEVEVKMKELEDKQGLLDSKEGTLDEKEGKFEIPTGHDSM